MRQEKSWYTENFIFFVVPQNGEGIKRIRQNNIKRGEVTKIKVKELAGWHTFMEAGGGNEGGSDDSEVVVIVFGSAKKWNEVGQARKDGLEPAGNNERARSGKSSSRVIVQKETYRYLI
jgi:hypothetical protein